MKILLFVQIFFIITSFFSGDRYQTLKKILRIGILSCVFIFLGYFVYSKNNDFQNQLSVTLINKNPEPLDFYTIEVKGKGLEDKINHIGTIRSNYYSIEKLQMYGTDEFWVIAFGEKKIKYFSRHVIQNKNEILKIEANHYLNQSLELSEKAREEILRYEESNKSQAVWLSLNILFLFVNLVTMFLRKKSH